MDSAIPRTPFDRLRNTRLLRGLPVAERSLESMSVSDLEEVIEEIEDMPPREWVAEQLGVELEPDNPCEIRDTLAGIARSRLASLRRRESYRGPKPGPSRIDRIKASVSVVQVAESHTDLRPAGSGKLKGLCPIHDERTPSFWVYLDQERWHCYGACGSGGDVIDLTRELMEAGKW